MICNAQSKWMNDLKKMWEESFGDAIEEIEEYYQTFYKEENVWCYCYDYKPVSVIYGIPATICQNGVESPVLYLYAGCTVKEFQGRGIYTNLIAEVVRRKKDNYKIILVPTSESLKLYEKLGFHCLQREKEQIFYKEEVEQYGKLAVTHLEYIQTASEYKRIRETYLQDINHVEWSISFYEYVFHSYLKQERIAFECIMNEEKVFLIGSKQADRFYIQEHSIPKEYLLDMI